MIDRFEENVGTYSIGAFPHNGSFAGTVYKDQKRLAETHESTLEEARNWVWRRVNELLVNDETYAKEPDHETMVRAFKALQPLNLSYEKMLSAHLHAPGRTITATELTKAAGHSGVQSSGNLHYGNLAYSVWCSTPQHLPLDEQHNRPAWTFALANGQKKDEWVWVMRPHVAEALLELGF